MTRAQPVATDDNQKRIAGRYVLGAPLGQGGMGVVALARDERLGRDVAIKLLSPTAVGGAVMRERLIREARALAALNNPGVVHVYDVGETDDGGAFLVMELVQGGSLTSLLKKRATPRPEWLRMIADAARTLGAAHRAGFVHRDVKPDNIMRRDDGRVVVLDFGIARRFAADDGPEAEAHSDDALGRLTVEGTLVGTPGYLAPEQAQGGVVDGRADQFALGVLLYRAMTGRAPWKGREFKELIAQIVHMTPAAPSTVVPGLPTRLDEVLARALAKAPEQRFPDMESFAEALDEVYELGVPPGVEASGSAEPTMPAISRSRPTPRSSIPPRTGGSALSTPPPDDSESPTVATSKPRTVPPVPIAPPSSTTPPPVTSRRRTLIVAALGTVALLALSGMYWRLRHGPAARVAAIGDHGTTLACPVLEVHEPGAGWLGAAAGATVCARARWMMGGDGEHTLAPAELLGLPRHPADSFPRDPYGVPTARRASLDAAARATAWIDGDVSCNGPACSVDLVVRTAGAHEVARASGRGTSLYEAVREAMDALERADALPRKRPLEGDAAVWMRVSDPSTAMALEDLALSRIQGGNTTAHECARIASRAGTAAGASQVLAAWCGATAPVAVDEASPSARAWTSMAHFESGGRDDPTRLARALQADLAREHSRTGRTVLARAAAETWLVAGDPAMAREDALLSVETDPESNPAWAVLARATAGLAGAGVTQRAYAAWFPESADAWTRSASAYDAAPGDLTRRIVAARRAAQLRPADPQTARRLAELLIYSGEREEARAMATVLRSGDADARGVGDLLALRLLASEGRLGAAYAQAQAALSAMPVFGQLASDTDLANEAMRLAWILGRPSVAADAFVTRFVDPDPPRLASSGPDTAVTVVAACAAASAPVSARCYERLRALLSARFWLLGSTPGYDDLLTGASRQSHGDFRGAAQAWRTLLATPGYVVFLLEDPMAQTFDRAGESDLASSVDADSVLHPGEYNGANLAYAREARREAARGHTGRARTLAQHVISAWATSDEPAPAVAEMRALIASLHAAPDGG